MQDEAGCSGLLQRTDRPSNRNTSGDHPQSGPMGITWETVDPNPGLLSPLGVDNLAHRAGAHPTNDPCFRPALGDEFHPSRPRSREKRFNRSLQCNEECGELLVEDDIYQRKTDSGNSEISTIEFEIQHCTSSIMPASTPKSDTLASSYSHGLPFLRSEEERQQIWKTHLFGYPISHSLSPILHSTLYAGIEVPWQHSLIESKDYNDFYSKLFADDCIGSAVTMPHKVTVISSKAVDEVTAEARAIGAVNTVFKRKRPDGSIKLIGTNTDCIGVRDSFLINHPDILPRCTGKPALVIGGGGACRSAIYALWKWLGASKIYLNCRLRSEVDTIIAEFEKVPEFDGELMYVETEEEARALEPPYLAVGTIPDITPVEPNELQARRVTLAFLENQVKGVCLEMCYHPRPITELWRLLKQNGWEVIPGTEAMIYQGIAQQVLWVEKPLEYFKVDEAEKTVREAVAASSH
jgi:quinate dehydrogenase